MAAEANKQQIDNLVSLLDGYATKGGHHLNVNVLALPASTLSISKVIGIIRMWLGSSFLGGRYSERLQMIEEIENENMK